MGMQPATTAVTVGFQSLALGLVRCFFCRDGTLKPRNAGTPTAVGLQSWVYGTQTCSSKIQHMMVQVQDPQDLQWIFETFGSYQILSILIYPYLQISPGTHPMNRLRGNRRHLFFGGGGIRPTHVPWRNIGLGFFNNDPFIYFFLKGGKYDDLEPELVLKIAFRKNFTGPTLEGPEFKMSK